MTNYKMVLVAALAAVGSAATAQANLISLDVGNNFPGQTSILFSGSSKDTFQFKGNNAGYNLSVKPSGVGASSDGYGFFSSGTWSIGSINYTKSEQWANVNTTPSTFEIVDASGKDLTGYVGLTTITTTGGAASLVINLTGLTYSGNNADLTALAATKKATIDLSFTVGESLTQIESSGLKVSSYGGTISAVPETSTSLAGIGAIGLLFLSTSMIKAAKRSLVGVGR
jgi:hypothetical protein